MTQDRAIVDAQYRGTANLEARMALHERFSTNRLRLPRWLFEQMALPVEARILEVGCGVGTFWDANRERIPPGWRATLSDRSPAMVEAARRRLDGQSQFAFATADVAQLAFSDASFDAMLAHFMLYHIDDLARAFAEIRRVLRPGGAFFAATNGPRHMVEARELAVQAGLMPPEAVDLSDAAGFNLENGGALLAPWFAEVTLRRYDDELIVTESGLLVAYIQSSWQMHTEVARIGAEEAARRTAALWALLEERLTAEGVIRVTKDSGLFVAKR